MKSVMEIFHKFHRFITKVVFFNYKMQKQQKLA